MKLTTPPPTQVTVADRRARNATRPLGRSGHPERDPDRAVPGHHEPTPGPETRTMATPGRVIGLSSDLTRTTKEADSDGRNENGNHAANMKSRSLTALEP